MLVSLAAASLGVAYSVSVMTSRAFKGVSQQFLPAFVEKETQSDEYKDPLKTI